LADALMLTIGRVRAAHDAKYPNWNDQLLDAAKNDQPAA
jgi:hypothetical protein